MKSLYTKDQILNTNSGFSFIEILVTVSIMGILLTIVLANFGSFNKSKRLTEATGDLMVNLRSASTKAFSGDRPCAAGETFGGYQVSYLSTSSYQVAALCDGDETLISTHEVANGVNFSGSWADFIFLPLDKGVDGFTDQLNIQLDLDSLCSLVTVATTGGIYVHACP